MRYPFVILAILILFLSGCVALNDNYRNKAGEVRKCTSAGFGVLGVPGAFVLQGMCDKRMKDNGFERL
jgi:hypothetical protein